MRAAAVPEREAYSNPDEMRRRLIEAQQAVTDWTPTTLEVDGREMPAWTASAYEDRMVTTSVDELTVFVHVQRWGGALALRRSTDRPDLAGWDDG